MNKNLIIRADASAHIGTGHIMRCIALAQAWQDNGGDVTFLSHCESPPIRQRIIDECFDFVPIEKPHPNPSDLKTTLTVLINQTNSATTPGLFSTAITSLRITSVRSRMRARGYW